MNDYLKWIGKTLAIAVFWVFALSITISGQPLFHYANDVLVQNSVVRSIDRQLGDFWDKAVTSVKLTFRSSPATSEKAQSSF